ncbi:MAG: transcriptional antiterminator NusG [Aquiluna sp.]|jgi:transcriptional antiterminator NusG
MSDLNFSDVASDAKATEDVEDVEAVDSQNVETDAAELNEVSLEPTDDALVAEAEAVEEAAVAVEEEPVVEEADPYLKFREELRGLDGKWYVVHSYAGYERRVKQNIETRKAALAGGDDILQIEVPMEESIEIKNGQRKLVSKVRIPGYVLVRMELNEDSWTLVRHTPAVTGFVGNSQHPTPLRPAEAFEMLKPLFTPEETEEVKNSKAAGNGPGGKAKSRSIPVNIDFKIGESILIKDGSFAGLPGTISEIKPESGKVTVLVSLFERETPVELAFDQVGPLN